MFGFRLLRVLAPLAVVCGALFAVSCGSSNTTPSSSPTSYPTNAADVITLSTSPGQIALPQVSPGASLTLTYIGTSASPFPSPFPTSGVTMSATVYATAPTNALPPTAFKRAKAQSLGNVVGVEYVTFTLSLAMPTSFLSTEVLSTGTNLPVNQPYFIELDDLTSQTYINTFAGSAVNNGSVTFTNANGYNAACNGFAISLSTGCSTLLNSNDTYLMQVYYLTTGVPASPSPSPSPVSTGTIPPVATPTPVAVATTVPLGAAVTIDHLPVVAGGFIAGKIQIPAAGTSATTLTVSGSPTLPSAISISGPNANSLYPLYVLGFTASGTVTPFASPAFSVILPSNVSTTTYPIEGALCTAAACPVDNSDENIAPGSLVNGVVTFNAGAFPGFTSVSTNTQYIIVYSSRATPPQNDASPVPIAAGATGTVTLPTIPVVVPTAASYSGTLTVGGLGGATTVNVSTEAGLLPNVSAIVPNTQTIFYSLSLAATPQVAAGAPLCGSAGCALVSLNVPAALVTTLPASNYFFVEECSATACPLTTTSFLELHTPTAPSYALTVPGTFGADIKTLSPTPVYLVFYTQFSTATPPP